MQLSIIHGGIILLELIAVSSDGPMEILTYLHSIQNIDGEIYEYRRIAHLMSVECHSILHYVRILTKIDDSFHFRSCSGEFFFRMDPLILVKSITNPITAIESSCVRFSNDLGRITAVLQSMRLWRLTERFDYAATGEWIWGERRLALLKLTCQTSFFALFWWLI